MNDRIELSSKEFIGRYFIRINLMEFTILFKMNNKYFFVFKRK